EGAQPAKAGTPNTARFMVTIHARKRLQAFHEPPVRCPPFRVPETQGHAKAWTPNSAVPVHGPNVRPKLEVEATHEPRTSNLERQGFAGQARQSGVAPRVRRGQRGAPGAATPPQSLPAQSGYSPRPRG